MCPSIHWILGCLKAATDHFLRDVRVGREGGDALGRGRLLQDHLDRRVAVERHLLGQFLGVLANGEGQTCSTETLPRGKESNVAGGAYNCGKAFVNIKLESSIYQLG